MNVAKEAAAPQGAAGWIARGSNACRGMATAVRGWWTERLFVGPASRLAGAGDERPGETGFFGSWQALALLAVLAAAMMLTNLAYPLVEPDETRYSHVAAEMIRTGDYLVPRRLGKAFLDKPPLTFWLSAASMELFGQNELAARLPIALAGFATVLGLFVLGKRIFPARAAWIGAVLLLLATGYAIAARFVITDCVLTLCATLAALCGLLAVRGEKLDLRWWLATSLACGVGTMVKGPLALILFGPPLVAYLWLTPAAARVRVGHWAMLLGITTLIAGPWFVAIAIAEPTFFDYFFLKHNVQRFTNTFHHAEPFWFYLPVIVGCMLPTSLLFPALAAFVASGREELRAQRSWELGYLLLVAAWVFGFFSAASGKLPTYILPLLPVLCLALGCTFHAGILRETPHRVLRWFATFGPRQAALGFAFFLALIGVGQIVLMNLGKSAADWVVPLDAALVAAAMVGYVTLLVVPFRHLQNWGVALALGWVMCTYGMNRFYPTIAQKRSYMHYAAQMADAEAGGRSQSPVAFFNSNCEGAEFCIDAARLRQFRPGDEQTLVRLIRQQKNLIIVASPGAFAELKRKLPADVQLLTTGPRRFVHRVSVQAGEAATMASRPADVRR